MQVYSHYHLDASGIAYRWRTLLQFGDAWEVIGTIFLQHLGTTAPLAKVEDTKLLSQLIATEGKDSGTWYAFKPCPTMRAIETLFTERNGGKALSGIIQIFHLTNVCGGEKKSGNYESNYAHTTAIDNAALVPPIYLGWGDVTKLLPHLRAAAYETFHLVTAPAFDQHYLTGYFDKNTFVHPLSLMVTNKDAFESVLYRRCFLENTTKPEGINELLHQHHVAVKNASRCQEIQEFLPSFSIAPLSTPRRESDNRLSLRSAEDLTTEITCEENEFILTFYHPSQDVDAVIDMRQALASHGFKPSRRDEQQCYTKIVPVYFVENIYTDVQMIAAELRKK